MKQTLVGTTLICLGLTSGIAFANVSADLGPRPMYLVDNMDESALKTKLQACEAGPFHRSDFSIGHRGAAMQFPEHTKESYLAAVAQALGYSSVTLLSRKTKNWYVVIRKAICIQQPMYSPSLSLQKNVLFLSSPPIWKQEKKRKLNVARLTLLWRNLKRLKEKWMELTQWLKHLKNT